MRIDYSSKAGVGLTLCDHTCTVIEARGLYVDCITRDYLEKVGANAAFQWETQWNGHRISFASDSEPTLLLLIGMYAKVRQKRYKISEYFGNNTKFDINFIARDFTLVRTKNVIWDTNLASFCNKYMIKHYWMDHSLWTMLNYLTIQDWNETVMMNRCSNYGTNENLISMY